jgi:hypothetical protein
VYGAPSADRQVIIAAVLSVGGRALRGVGMTSVAGPRPPGISPVREMRRIVGRSLTGTAGLEASRPIILARDARRAGDALPTAIRARDLEQARRAVHDHIEQTQEDLRLYVLKTEPPARPPELPPGRTRCIHAHLQSERVDGSAAHACKGREALERVTPARPSSGLAGVPLDVPK